MEHVPKTSCFVAKICGNNVVVDQANQTRRSGDSEATGGPDEDGLWLEGEDSRVGEGEAEERRRIEQTGRGEGQAGGREGQVSIQGGGGGGFHVEVLT